MDRIALSVIASGLVVILCIVVAVLGGTQGALAELVAPGAAFGGLSIVGGLVMLERRAFAAARHSRAGAFSA
ncbi:hypothetical protein [Muricoccus vinaceus]|uniref:Uncharacterized protein n=1 Tax=Muricoccus vinaceus TaxID=424704 RepID=A0ABV6IK76_9PROT